MPILAVYFIYNNQHKNVHLFLFYDILLKLTVDNGSCEFKLVIIQ